MSMRKRNYNFQLTSPIVEEYLTAQVERDPIFKSMEKHAKALDFPIIGPLCGQACYLLTRMTQAKTVCELGSGFGYSTAWFAKGVQENHPLDKTQRQDKQGSVHHVVWSKHLAAQAKQYLEALNLTDYIHFHLGEALAYLTQCADQSFDIIFNDVDKQLYPESLTLVEKKLRPGGLLIVDNMLWHGRVMDKEDQANSTNGIRQLNQALLASPQWVTSLLPIRDGLMVAYKQ